EKGTARHEPRYLLQRFVLADLGQEFTTWMTVLDVCRGVPAIYAVFAGYDEVAHRRGPYAPAALAELAAADRALARIAEAIRLRPEFGYELFVLSDHGQEATRPAERVLHGVRLADWILAGGPTSAQWTTPSPTRRRRPPPRLRAAPLARRWRGGSPSPRGGGGRRSGPRLLPRSRDPARSAEPGAALARRAARDPRLPRRGHGPRAGWALRLRLRPRPAHQPRRARFAPR